MGKTEGPVEYLKLKHVRKLNSADILVASILLNPPSYDQLLESINWLITTSGGSIKAPLELTLRLFFEANC